MRRLCWFVLLLCMVVVAGAQEKGLQQAAPSDNSGAFTGTLGKSSLTMSGNWAFHTGDDLAWAQPSLDDTKWERITADDPWGAQGHPGYTGYAWYRRAVEIEVAPGAQLGPVSIYIPPVNDAYEVYWNGEKIGGFGRLPPHAKWYNQPASNVFALPPPVPGAKPEAGGRLKGVLAIRVWKAMLDTTDSLDGGGLNGEPRIGESKTIANALALEEDAFERARLIRIVESVVLLLVGMIAIGMWAFDRSRRLPLWLGVFLLGLVGQDASLFPAWRRIQRFDWDQVHLGVVQSAEELALWMLILVLFGLDKERVWQRMTAAVAAVYLAAQAIDVTVFWFWASGWQPLRTIDRVVSTIGSSLPAYLFVLLVAGLRRRRDLTLLPTVLACALLESYVIITNAAGQGVQFTGVPFQTIFAAATLHLGPYNLSLYGQLQALVLVVLVATIYRVQVQERRRQVFVESELRSAREIQSVLVPEETPAVPGFAIGSLYWPAGEVGGDLFQVLPGEDGDVTVVLADVSGKGLKAAMTVSLMVGAVRTLADATTSPMAILAGLNKRLMGRTDGGFSTCLVLHITANGEVTMANAGHLAPFLNGEAMELEGSLPLGIVAGAEFSESRFTLREGDEVSIYTDGVLEAQNEAEELFGFERCEALMRRRPTVQEIAEAAKAFGQKDDITVVKIARVTSAGTSSVTTVDLRTAQMA
jgi:hypothetical protein